MRKILLASAVLSLAATAAFAVPAPKPAPAPVSTASMSTGFVGTSGGSSTSVIGQGTKISPLVSSTVTSGGYVATGYNMPSAGNTATGTTVSSSTSTGSAKGNAGYQGVTTNFGNSGGTTMTLSGFNTKFGGF